MEGDPAEDEPPEDGGLNDDDADPDADAEANDELAGHVSPDVLRKLSAFSALQRHVAGIDLSAIRSIRRTFEQSTALAELPKFAAAQSAVVESIRRSIDMTGIQAVTLNTTSPCCRFSSSARASPFARSTAPSRSGSPTVEIRHLTTSPVTQRRTPSAIAGCSVSTRH